MSAFYVDTSALAKRHLVETGPAWVRSESPTFVSGDRNLLAAAAADGFDIDDPNAHA